MDEKTVIFRTINLAITGMTCDKCSMTVSKALRDLNGVDMVDVDLGSGEARVLYTPDKLEVSNLTDAVKAAGYEAKYIGAGNG